MTTLPGDLEAGIQSILDNVSRKAVMSRARAMSEAYRAGGGSGGAIADDLDIAAYLTTRMPATFAAIAASLRELARIRPDFAPRTCLDLCAGPGTASWAAVEAWPGLARVTLLDAHRGLLAIARRLAAASVAPAMRAAETVEVDILDNAAPLPRADLVVMAYAMVELAQPAIAALVKKVWGAADILVLVEPGTPEGFRRIRLVRDLLLELDAVAIAPCPHDLPCPIVGPDWCHFSRRLPRSRDHRLIKGASAPFEDERYIYLAVGRTWPKARPATRIIAPVNRSKAQTGVKLCTEGAIVEKTIRRGDPLFVRTKKVEWGDALPAGDEPG